LNISKLKSNSTLKTFLAINFGCRVNAAETNQWSQTLINQGFTPATIYDLPSTILINTCSITKKGEKESINKVKILHQKYPKANIIVTGCASFTKIQNLKNIIIYQNQDKEKILKKLKSSYTPKIKDKFSNTNRFLLKIQSGCTQFCSYCIVPFKRNYLYSLPISTAIKTVNQAVNEGYKEIIITGVNIDQYQYDLSLLLKSILDNTNIQLISFGSIPLNCITQDFITLYQQPKYKKRLSPFLHIPIQSGSDKILKLMNRPYTKKNIVSKFLNLKSSILDLKFGTDIIVGFPTETDIDFQKTLDLCRQIGFSKIHVFPFSPRPNTKARIIFENSPKISKETLKSRSQKIRNSIK
jgi:threonylcarbamoyladenosine tRNA methylthiotransferase MtaB